MISSDFATDPIVAGDIPSLPMKGVPFPLGNDIGRKYTGRFL